MEVDQGWLEGPGREVRDFPGRAAPGHVVERMDRSVACGVSRADYTDSVLLITSLRRWRWRGLAAVVVLVVGWLGSSFAVADRLTRRHGAPAGDAPEVPFARTETVALLARDGARVPGWAFDVQGARGTVVLLHPNGGTAASMREVAELWAELGWASLALTLRAHGEAEGARNDVGWSARLDVVAGVEWAVSRRAGPVIVHGVSLGAAAACLAAPEHGERARRRIVGHVLEAPYVDLVSAVEARTTRELAWPLGTVAAVGLRLVAPQFIGDLARIAPLGAAPELAGSVLLLSGLLDTRAPAAGTRRFAAVLGTRATLVERELGHTGWLAAGPGGPLRADLAAWLVRLAMTAPE